MVLKSISRIILCGVLFTLIFQVPTFAQTGANYKNLPTGCGAARLINDFNNDGFRDILCGHPSIHRIQIYSGKNGDGNAGLLSDSGACVQLSSNGSTCAKKMFRGGSGVVDAGDQNGDGVSDFAVCGVAIFNGATRPNLGIYSGADGSIVALKMTEADRVACKDLERIGDVDDNGIPDLLITADGHAEVLSHDGNGTLSTLWYKEASTLSDYNQYSFRFGSGVPDSNGNGTPDVMLSDHMSDTQGMTSNGAAHIFDGLTGDLVKTFIGQVNNERFGLDMARYGDYNEDGVIDMAIIAHNGRRVVITSVVPIDPNAVPLQADSNFILNDVDVNRPHLDRIGDSVDYDGTPLLDTNGDNELDFLIRWRTNDYQNAYTEVWTRNDDIFERGRVSTLNSAGAPFALGKIGPFGIFSVYSVHARSSLFGRPDNCPDLPDLQVYDPGFYDPGHDGIADATGTPPEMVVVNGCPKPRGSLILAMQGVNSKPGVFVAGVELDPSMAPLPVSGNAELHMNRRRIHTYKRINNPVDGFIDLVVPDIAAYTEGYVPGQPIKWILQGFQFLTGVNGGTSSTAVRVIEMQP